MSNWQLRWGYETHLQIPSTGKRNGYRLLILFLILSALDFIFLRNVNVCIDLHTFENYVQWVFQNFWDLNQLLWFHTPWMLLKLMATVSLGNPLHAHRISFDTGRKRSVWNYRFLWKRFPLFKRISDMTFFEMILLG